MKGHGSLNPNSVRNKWMHINQIIRDKKIGVLLLQETHMSKTRHNETQKLFWKRLKIFSSEDPENPTGKGGVVIVLNKALIQTKGQENIKTTEIIPGRALLMSIKYRPPEPPKLTVLVVYSPNEHGKNKLFWDEIKTFFENHPHIPRPDIMAGDFNVVEDTIDRLPTHPDPPDATDALDSLKSDLRLQDGWHNTYPSTKSYTFLHSNGSGSQSRIDRIYVKNKMLETAREWKITSSALPNTDHCMVMCK